MLAWYDQDYYRGQPAITRNSFGKGHSYYVGTALDKDGLSWLTQQACETAGIQSSTIPSGVEVIWRSNGPETFQFILNYSAEEVCVPIDRPAINLVTRSAVSEKVVLGGVDAAILQFPAAR